MGATAAAGCAVIALANPGDTGVPLCASRAMFGVDCAFCGGIRCTNSLLRGDILGALDHNLILAVALPVIAVAWIFWMTRQLLAEPVMASPKPSALYRLPKWLSIGGGLTLLAFGLIRNFTGATWLIWLHSDSFRT